MSLRALAGLLLLGICGVTSFASARAPILTGLSWVRLDGAERCISTVELAERVEAKLRRTVFAPASAAELTIEGFVVARDTGGFRARLAVVALDGRVLGTRELEVAGGDCRELDEALTLVIAVTLNPESGISSMSMLSPEVQATLDRWLSEEPQVVSTRATRRPATVAIPRPPLPRSAARAETVLDDAEASVTRWRQRKLQLDAGAIGGAGMLPSPAFGFEVGGMVVPSGFLPVALALQGFLPRTVPAFGFEQGTVSFLLLRAALMVCPGLVQSSLLDVDGCIGIDSGMLSIDANDYLFNKDVVRPVLDALLQANTRVRVSDGWALRIGLTLALPVTRARIETRQISQLRAALFEVSPVTVALHLGLSAAL